jgi:RNA polymerase sigma-70 factor (ECF subfamily)
MDQNWMEDALRQWRETGRAEALGELLKAHRNRAFTLAARMMSVQADAEDVVQDAFTKLFTHPVGLEDLAVFERSVNRAVVQCALDALRKKKRGAIAAATLRRQTPDSLAAGNDPMTNQAEEQETRACLKEALAELPDDESAPVVLCYYQGLSVVETAKTLELPRETVRARIARALENLRARLLKRERALSAAAIIALMGSERALDAPASLCTALDKALPGRPCVQLSAVPHTAGFQPVLSRTVARIATAAIAAGAIYLGVSWFGSVHPAGRTNERNTNDTFAAAEAGESQKNSPRNQPGSVETLDNKETETVKSKTAAAVLAAGLMLPSAIRADEPANPAADAAIAKIAARQTEKDAAANAATAGGSGGGKGGKRPGADSGK